MLKPLIRDVSPKIVHMSERERTQSGRQRVVPAVVRDAEGALELDRRLGALVYLGKAKYQLVLLKLDPLDYPLLALAAVELPLAIPNLPHDS